QLNNLLIRTQGDAKKASVAVRAALAALDQHLPLSWSMISLEEGPLRVQKLMAGVYARVAVMLACLALGFAAIGIYGVIAYVVGQRTGVIVIRMAFGATQGDVLRLVIWQALRPVMVGAALGLAGSAGVSSLLHAALIFPSNPDLLFGVGLLDPV